MRDWEEISGMRDVGFVESVGGSGGCGLVGVWDDGSSDVKGYGCECLQFRTGASILEMMIEVW